MSKKSDLLYFCQFEVIDKKIENIIIEIDYVNHSLSKYIGGVKFTTILFSEFCTVQTDGEFTVLLKHSNPNYHQLFSFTSFNKNDCNSIFQLLDNIIENKSELQNKESTLIRNLCASFKDKICLKYSVVHQKSFKVSSKFLKKNKPNAPSNPPASKKNLDIKKSSASISFLLLTESHLFCFESENKTIPLYIFPNSEIVWKRSSSDEVKFQCKGSSGVFHISDIEQRYLWFEACEQIPKVSEEQVFEIERVINQIRELFATTFDKTNKHHINYLRRLWDASQLNVENDKKFQFEIQCERWKDLGFQRDDPVSDFRATGMIGLQNLVYFAETYSGMFLHISRNQQQSADMTEYPFATAGINISYLLIQLLRLKREEDWFPNMQAYPLFFHTIRAWEELYTIIFRLFDQKWNQMNVGYMGFQKVIDATKEGVEELLNRRTIVGVPAIFDMLGILLEDLHTFRSNVSNSKMSSANIPAIRSSTNNQLLHSSNTTNTSSSELTANDYQSDKKHNKNNDDDDDDDRNDVKDDTKNLDDDGDNDDDDDENNHVRDGNGGGDDNNDENNDRNKKSKKRDSKSEDRNNNNNNNNDDIDIDGVDSNDDVDLDEKKEVINTPERKRRTRNRERKSREISTKEMSEKPRKRRNTEIHSTPSFFEKNNNDDDDNNNNNNNGAEKKSKKKRNRGLKMSSSMNIPLNDIAKKNDDDDFEVVGEDDEEIRSFMKAKLRSSGSVQTVNRPTLKTFSNTKHLSMTSTQRRQRSSTITSKQPTFDADSDEEDDSTIKVSKVRHTLSPEDQKFEEWKNKNSDLLLQTDFKSDKDDKLRFQSLKRSFKRFSLRFNN